MPILMRRNALCILCLLICAAAAPGAWAKPLPPVVQAALQRAAIPAGAVGLYVQDVSANKSGDKDNGKVLAAVNETVAFIPASIMKLVTSGAALELLGPAFTWKTRAYASGPQVGDVLQGDLIIKGSGDPKLVIENFWLFMRRIRAQGIREISGNLLLDRSAFVAGMHDAASFDGDPMKPYNAGPDALLLNYKAFKFQFAPDPANGLVRLTLDPAVAGYRVIAPRLSQRDCGDWQAKLQATINGGGANFGGDFAASCGEKTWYLHPHQLTQTQYFDMIFRQIWGELGGTFKGQVQDGSVPNDARLVAEWESATLPEIIRDINKFSNNVMARQLLLTLGANALPLPASRERGIQAIKDWLAGKGMAAADLTMENGSGLSRNERISAGTLAGILIAAFHAPTMPEFISSLPLVGYDGTMRQRLRHSSVAGRAHIKSGSLNEVRAVAGYVLAASGKRYAVVCIINHANAARAQEVHDALLQWIYEQG